MTSFERSQKIHSELKKRGVEILPSGSAPAWWIHKTAIGDYTGSASYDSDVAMPMCPQCSDGDTSHGIMSYACPDYSNASNSLKAFLALDCEGDINLPGLGGDKATNVRAHFHSFHYGKIIVIGANRDEALERLLCKALKVEYE